MTQKEKLSWGGNGTEENPYQIKTKEDLNKLCQKVRLGYTYTGRFFELKNDIAWEGVWQGIGTDNSRFDGSFNGNNYTISGIQMNTSIQCGFFNTTGHCAKIQKLKLKGSIKISGQIYACGLIAAVNNGNIKECQASFQVDVENVALDCYAGTLVGINQITGTVSNCNGELEMNCTAKKAARGIRLIAGGICGSNMGKIIKCISACKGDLSAMDRACLCAAGIAAQNANNAKICNSQEKLSWKINGKIYMITQENKGTIEDCSCGVDISLMDDMVTINGKGKIDIAYGSKENHDQNQEQKMTSRESNEQAETTRIISDKLVLGQPGQTYQLAYDNIVFIEDGCMDIYGNVDITIHTVTNEKTGDSIVPYEFCINDKQSMHGNIHIGGLTGSIKITAS